MLKCLALAGVGPAKFLEIDFSSRLNLITGDNGLGKSFLLDVAWWALTRTWAREVILPPPGTDSPSIEAKFSSKVKAQHDLRVTFDRQSQKWSAPRRGRPPIPGLVIYTQVDGGFSCWDPARNYWQDETQARPAKFGFLPDQVWNGNEHCEGLVRDWASWQREGNQSFHLLERVLRALSADPELPIRPGVLRIISLEDPKKYPTLVMPYGQEVPVVHASAGMRRIIALAYLLVWTWTRHLEACQLIGQPPANELLFLIDEMEAHLHPQWQRRVAPALLAVTKELTGLSVQLLATTHSPLVMASCEPLFDPKFDTVWELGLQDHKVTLEQFPWHRRGDANAWLTSSVFNLKRARSVEAEQALLAAQEILRQSLPKRSEIHRVTQLLQASLSDTDPFWVRWSALG
ncbi:ATP-binding protein [bacterium]|nr:ATP-binding protein [bacterium]